MFNFIKKNLLVINVIFLSISINNCFAVEKEIVIAVNNWTSQIVVSKILKQVLISQGHKVALKEVSVNDQWGQLARGWQHIQVEVWQGTMEKSFNKLVSEGRIVDTGSHDAITREDWWYPLYVKKLCPGLPDWKALKKCSHIFKTNESGDKGHYLGGPWEKPEGARIRALELDFIITRVKKGDDLWVNLKDAFKKKRPILLFNWTPNWVEYKFKGEFVNFPDYDPKCETESTWGINKKWKYDCGNPKAGWLKKATWSGLKSMNRCAFETVQNLNFSNHMIAQVSSLVDSDGQTTDQAAESWIKRNKETWKKWIPKDCKRQERED